MSSQLTLVDTKDDAKVRVDQLKQTQINPTTKISTKIELTSFPSDHRLYRYLELENGARVLLIHNNRAAVSSGSLNVLVGSYQDPEKIDGFVHFLEHALFMGCEKYPVEEEFQKFINTHSGKYDGATGDDYTRFAFDIVDDLFEEALDRLQAFITKPLFMESSIEREINAVHNEFCEDLDQDSERSGYINKLIVNPEHPERRFNCGNRDSLKAGKQLIPKLKAFHQQHYVGKKMIVILESKMPLDKLEALAVTYFSNIPKSVAPTVDTPLPLKYLKDSLGISLQIESVEGDDYFILRFIINEARSIETSHALSYISNMLNYPGENGLFDHLLKEDLIKESTAKGSGYGAESSYIDDKQVEIILGFPLTDRGKKGIAEITAITLQYIDYIKNQGVDPKYFKRMQETSARSLQFSADGIVPSFFENLRQLPLEKFFVGSMTLPNSMFPKEIIRRILDSLTFDKMLQIIFQSEEFEEQSEPEVEPITENYLERPVLFKRAAIHAPAPQALSQRFTFKLPEESPYVPSEFTLKPQSSSFSYPKLILNEPHRLWHSRDLKFNKPFIVTYCYLLSNLVKDNVENTICANLLVELIENQIEKKYRMDFEYASSSVSISTSMRGLYISVSGYSHKHRDIVMTIMTLLSSFTVEEQAFEESRMNMIEYNKSIHTNPPLDQCISRAKLILNQYYYSPEAIIAALEKMTIHSLFEYIQKFIASVKLEMYCHGNLTVDETMELGGAIAQKLNLHPVGFVPPKTSIIDLKLGTEHHIVLKNQQKMNAAIIYLQTPDISTEADNLICLLEKVIHPSFFAELRTQKQLGYSVECSQFIFEHTRGLMFILSSADYSAEYLIEEMEKFIANYLNEILKITEQQFSEIKAALTKIYNESLTSCHSPSDYASIFNCLLNLGLYNFKIMTQYRDVFKDLTLKDMQNFYKKLIAKETIRKLIVKTEANSTSQDLRESNRETKIGTEIVEIDAFKVKQTNYPDMLTISEAYIQTMLEFNRLENVDPKKGERVDVYAIDVLEAMKPTVFASNKTATDLVLTYSFGHYKDSLSSSERRKIEEALAREKESQQILFAQARAEAAARKRQR